MNLSEHFTLAELTVTHVNLPNVAPPEIAAKLGLLCQHILEPVRQHYGRPVRVNSAYRSPAVNAAIGSTPTSQHPKGEAVDFEVPGVSNADLALWCAEHLPFDQLILEHYKSGVPDSGWVHCSWKPVGRRHQTLTIPSRGNPMPGLVL